MLAALMAGCGAGSHASTGSAGPAATTHSGTVRIVMQTLAFVPDATHASVGQTVEWRNRDNVPHNVIYVSGPKFTSSPPKMRIGATYSIRLTQPGTIHYYCSIHPWMKATIVVR